MMRRGEGEMRGGGVLDSTFPIAASPSRRVSASRLLSVALKYRH